jgi:N-acetylglucosaminyldiphosphoundecaprenol N-acetyl-beta-D-mannosaminyltransferase
MKKVNILSVDIAAASRESLLNEVVHLLRGGEPRTIAKVNAEFLLRSLNDEQFRAYLGSTHLNLADGVGVLWAARFLTLTNSRLEVLRRLEILWQATYTLASLVLFPPFCRNPIPERLPGVDALLVMLAAAQEAKAPVFFLGARSDINERARREIQARYPRLLIAGGRDGYTDDCVSAVREIDESGATLLVVALGSPKQEYWIRDNLSALGNVRVAVGEGGSLDFIAGDFCRAPGWMQALGLEWLWRLFMNRNKSGSVSRIRRVWNAVPVFIYHVVRWKLEHGPARLDEQEQA